MKKTILILTAGIALAACGQKKVCLHNGQEVDCAYYDLYKRLAETEAKINATFADNAPYMPFEEEKALREEWVALYTAKKDSLEKAYELVGESQMLKMMSEMRLQEVEYFRQEAVEREELKTTLKSLDIQIQQVDTSFWGGDPQPTILWTITNNTDKAFASLQVDRVLYMDGKPVKSDNSTYLFSNDQIVPQPAEGEDAVVKPGSSVTISFDVPSQGELKPEIVGIGFIEE